jgi:general secretion pathway protein A
VEYYKLLQLKREPFSNTPDPECFFESRQHVACLQKLELALRLKRGLNVVMGDVGTGKTTLCRELIRRLAADSRIETHLLLDPSFDFPGAFLGLLHAMLCGHAPGRGHDGPPSEMAMKERIKQALFEKGVVRNQTVVLIIDEGQKIPGAVLEILRELLNYETNQFKLLQIVIFAQQEFGSLLEAHPNFADRINLLHRLAPLGFGDTRRMIRHRIRLSSQTPKPVALFTLPAMWAIYRATRGYPRKIIHLCHHSVLALIIQNRTRAGWALVRSCRNRMRLDGNRWRRRLAVGLPVLAIALALAFALPDALFERGDPLQRQLFKIMASEQGPPAPATTPATNAGLQDLPPLPLDLFFGAGTLIDGLAGGPATRDPADGQTPAPAAAAIDAAPRVPLAEPPRLLGQVAVKYGDTLRGLSLAVYGSTANRYIRALIAANPQIQDPDSIEPGDVIAFPATPYPMTSEDRAAHCIVLEEHETLPAALQRRRELRREAEVPVRIVPHWTPVEGLRFLLTADTVFSGRQEAADRAAALPESWAAGARIQSGWPEGTRIYSNVFASRDR